MSYTSDIVQNEMLFTDCTKRRNDCTDYNNYNDCDCCDRCDSGESPKSDDCPECPANSNACNCYDYDWKDYEKFNNCRGENCTECIREILSKHNYCLKCFKLECVCNMCKKCDSPYECVCDILISHGHCSQCLYYGEDCQCKIAI